jgi:hypothetical protein
LMVEINLIGFWMFIENLQPNSNAIIYNYFVYN